MNCFFINYIKINKKSLLRLVCGQTGYYKSLGANNKNQVEKVKIFGKKDLLKTLYELYLIFIIFLNLYIKLL